MKVKDLMSRTVVRISPEETVAVAARMLEHYNVGVLPVCTGEGQLLGVVTDRDLVTRCLAGQRAALSTKVREVMTGAAVCVEPDAEVSAAAGMMAGRQIRRLPVVRGGILCGMISLGDLSKHEESSMDAADALAMISSNVRRG